MISALFFVLAFAGFAALHSLLASARLKRRLFEVLPVFRYYYRLFYNVVALVTFGLFWWAVPVVNFTLYEVSAPAAWLMHLVQLAGLAGLLYSLRCVDTGYFSGMKQLRDASGHRREYHLDEPAAQQLVFTGPFRYVRHPLYSFSLLVLFFTPVMTLKWALFSSCSLLYFVMGSRLEEQKLTARFGRQYEAYRRQVPALIPLPGRRLAD